MNKASRILTALMLSLMIVLSILPGVAEEGTAYHIRIACDNEASRAENFIMGIARVNEELKASGSKDSIEAEYLMVEKDFDNNMALWAMNNDLPEVIVGGITPINRYAVSGFLIPVDFVLDTEPYQTDVPEKLREYGRVQDGKLYGIIQDMEIRPVWFFKPALVKLGYDDAAMKELARSCGAGEFTMSDLQALAKQAVDQKITEWGILHRPTAGAEFSNLLAIFNGGKVPYDLEQSKVLINKPALLAYLTFMRENVSLGLTPPDMTTTSWSIIEGDLWPNGKTLSWFGGVWNKWDMMVSGNVSSEYVDENYLLTPMPVATAGDPSISLSSPKFYGVTTSVAEDPVLQDYIARAFGHVLDPDIQVHHTVDTAHLAITESALSYPDYVNSTFLSENTYLLEYSYVAIPDENRERFETPMYNAIQTAEMTSDDLVEAVENWVSEATFQMEEGSYIIID